jgi:hypothetical protein
MLYKIIWLPRYNWKIVESGVKHHRAIKHTFIGRLEETAVPEEDHPPQATDKLYHIRLYREARGVGVSIYWLM